MDVAQGGSCLKNQNTNVRIGDKRRNHFMMFSIDKALFGVFEILKETN